MAFLSLVFVVLVCAPYLVTGAAKPLPSVYIQMDFKFTWSEFCLLETYFKTKLADMILQDNGQPINASQIYLNNFDENCPAKNNVDKASLLFYVITPGGTFQDVDKDMTKQAFKILHYLVENQLGRTFGPLFQLKITKVEAKGNDAPPKPTGFTEMERTYIAIGIAVGILAIIVCILTLVFLTKRKSKPNPNSRRKHTHEVIGEENKLEFVESEPNANVNVSYEEPPTTETRFNVPEQPATIKL
ncbi:hypothetical protein OS493_016436 [Desmophyllum pertusum]|uniref:Uncharacterized protein n=1 Tax=Desmophyllum pertusum TaxID=174260 RepID=A0A9W9ZR41_9CNID|nr:hypothetical protein OS493_016436 [Desmophyllum pertusum]